MGLLRRQNSEPCTYWAPGESDAFGGVLFCEPICIYGHYEEMLSRMSVQGAEVESTAMCVVDRDLAVGGLLLWGDYTKENKKITDAERGRAKRRARKILKFELTPGIRKVSSHCERVAYM